MLFYLDHILYANFHFTDETRIAQTSLSVVVVVIISPLPQDGRCGTNGNPGLHRQPN